MEKGKSVVEADDRLSELPNSLIFDIFSFLPMSDVVRTTILSKRWQNLWTSVSHLNLQDEENMSTDEVANFVNQALNSWRGINLVRFKLDFICKHEKKSIATHIDSWLRFAVEKKVQELELYFPDRNHFSGIELYLLPQYVYSCSSLTVLWLTSCDFQIHGNVQWDQLESLVIDGEIVVSEDAINRILLGAPRLEVLSLALCDSSENLSIRSTSLEELVIEKRLLGEDDAPSMDTELRIWAPKLTRLEMKGIPYGKCLLMEVPSLIYALLKFDGPDLYRHDWFVWTDFLGEALAVILPKIKHVYTVVLSNWCIKALGAMREEDKFYLFPHVGYLGLNVCSREYKQIVVILEMFPDMRKLVLDTTYKSVPKHIEGSIKFDTGLSYLFLRRLERVDVTWNKGDDSIFPLIQFLLKKGRNLEKMVFRERRTGSRTSWKSLFMAVQKLVRMPRSSPTAELIFY